MARKGKLKAETRDQEERPVRLKRYHYLLLIVCEDEKTEKHYFEQFKVLFPERTIYQRTIGTGFGPQGVVERALEERQALQEEAGKEVDKTWVAFDKDDAEISDGKRARYETAFTLAIANNVDLADSNECFEIWLLLHLVIAHHQQRPRIECNPSTQAHLLVEDLRGWIAYYSYDPNN